ncbi:MAG: tRNA lysidine(34) synthetase TilS [Barnesiella sp.]|nr:tRNA lysidine(34) synthetase TilS [Barnesiella sp.]MBD5343937.1 tRNA lysidine(34) synthetase TilS [Bacteroides sp.]
MEKVRAYIRTHDLLADGGEVVVALSGGADSVALLVMLRRMGYSCLAAHCNFHLRGDESDRDMRHAMQLCEHLGVPLTIRHFDVAARVEATGESVEMACRSLRYDWFRSLLADRPGARLAVAHHLNDNVETFFLNALRGSGVAGLKGMLPRNGDIIRPLLGVTRAEIEEYLRGENIEFVTDSTNSENTFRRNRLRNVILPALRQSFPGADERISDTMSHLRADYALLADYESLLRERYTDPSGAIDVASLAASHPHPAEALYRLLRDRAVTPGQIDTILSDPMAAGLNFDGYTLDRGMLRPLSEHGFEAMTVVPGLPPLTMVSLTPDEFRPHRCGDTIWLDAAVMSGDPHFELRPWRQGDRFKPFGMKGSKKLSDLFVSHRLDENAKRAVRVLTRNGEILWVIGLRASRLFAVTPSTTEIIQLTINL